MARYYIGGILKHAPSLLAFTNPKAERIEFRRPDPSANPYLAFSARRTLLLRAPLETEGRQIRALATG